MSKVQLHLWNVGHNGALISRGRELTNSGRFVDLDADKLRGGYYTSSDLAQWMCSWAIRVTGNTVLEPSAGGGAFVTEAAVRLKSLGATPSMVRRQLRGVELIAAEARKASVALTKYVVGSEKCLEVSDFFDWYGKPGRGTFDCVIGNPPFIRYQSFPEPSRSRAMQIMATLGLGSNKLTNIWVPFVAASISCLNRGGRIAFVLPAELLQVSYAAPLRSYIIDRFRTVNIVACNEMFFAGAEQEVVLLLADDALGESSVTNACKVTMTEAKTVAEVTKSDPMTLGRGTVPKVVKHDSEKWLKYFLSASEITFMRSLRENAAAVTLSEHAEIDVGVVTGKNAFFILTQEQVDEFGLSAYTLPVVGRSAQLRGARLTLAEWRELREAGERVHLFFVGQKVNGSLSPGGRRYVDQGVEWNVHKGYKCSIRTPWYSVPSVWIPDCFFFRQIYDFPRVVINDAGATSTDTIHRMRCKGDPETVAVNLYTHLTAASAEIEGRSYGGGVLELEPTEAERLLVPAKLRKGLPLAECDRLIRAGRLEDVLLENDRLILRNGIGLSTRECAMLLQIWEKMRDRRMARGRKGRAPKSISSESP